MDIIMNVCFLLLLLLIIVPAIFMMKERTIKSGAIALIVFNVAFWIWLLFEANISLMNDKLVRIALRPPEQKEVK